MSPANWVQHGAEPVPTASPSPQTAANTAAICAEVDQLIIAKSDEIATDAAAATRRDLTPEQIKTYVPNLLAGKTILTRFGIERSRFAEVGGRGG